MDIDPRDTKLAKLQEQMAKILAVVKEELKIRKDTKEQLAKEAQLATALKTASTSCTGQRPPTSLMALAELKQRGNTKPSTPLYETQVCYYCKREGHRTYRWQELLKDKEQGLVRRNGKDWYLPNGQHIPWNPARTIRTVLAEASADPQMQEAARKLAESLKSGKTQAPATMKTSAQTIVWDPPQLGERSQAPK
ncbi:hypothetical protein PGT21_023134 [Puccinia graminis f. sp. tritici]|uniref:Uncharacterized protein n=1 Tax=Puccinia graminis f. sp. tritici TaxID=56615 RepID=A0A5B0NJW3_PUCGR|nr:hypothetical protein PGT21_023134 [Puccinia graminis f. sp. tritici]KAA1115602.1 hypothetical protein PGTUg99_009121 [Puccinia graminis f. sp. tritici]